MAATSGDSVVMLDGNYHVTLQLRRVGSTGAPFTYRALHPGAVTVDGVHLYGATHNVIAGLNVVGLPATDYGQVGVYLYADDATSSDYNTISDVAVSDVAGWGIRVCGSWNVLDSIRVTHSASEGVLFCCPSGDNPCTRPPTGNRLAHADISGSGQNGIGLDGGKDTVVEFVRSHDNRSNGWLDGQSDTGVVVRDSEFDHNGTTRFSHGVYTKARSGLFQRIRLHHNAGYGFHCWASCFGTADKPFVVEDSESYENVGSGFLAGGNSGEAEPGRDGYPHHVIFRKNRAYRNRGAGLYYLGECRTDPVRAEVSFVGNEAWDNEDGQGAINGCNTDAVTFRDNSFWSSDGHGVLIRAWNSRIPADTFDSDRLWRGHSRSRSLGTVIWDDVAYSFHEVRSSGVRQNSVACPPPYGARVKLESHGMWGRPRDASGRPQHRGLSEPHP